jgi:hypothetical protein
MHPLRKQPQPPFPDPWWGYELEGRGGVEDPASSRSRSFPTLGGATNSKVGVELKTLPVSVYPYGRKTAAISSFSSAGVRLREHHLIISLFARRPPLQRPTGIGDRRRRSRASSGLPSTHLRVATLAWVILARNAYDYNSEARAASHHGSQHVELGSWRGRVEAVLDQPAGRL